MFKDQKIPCRHVHLPRAFHDGTTSHSSPNPHHSQGSETFTNSTAQAGQNLITNSVLTLTWALRGDERIKDIKTAVSDNTEEQHMKITPVTSPAGTSPTRPSAHGCP